ncbi:MAG: iron chelate uptake ABC transporter family permease subunit [Pseudohongiellaceae bacterium]
MVTELLTTNFFLYALLAGLAVAAVAGPLGSLIVWRRMAYVGDTLAHSTLLGIAIGLLTGGNLQLAILLTALVFAALLTLLERKPTLASDTILGILAHSSLALGVLVLALTSSLRVDLESYLFGALLTINTSDLIWVLAATIIAALTLFRLWNAFLATTVHAELAQVEGHNTPRLKLILSLLIALTIAVSMKIVGVLLITSLLIIPPAAARRLSSTPEQMALLASIIGCLSVILGLLLAFYANIPVGPTIVVVATVFFVVLFFFPSGQKSGRG